MFVSVMCNHSLMALISQHEKQRHAVIMTFSMLDRGKTYTNMAGFVDSG